MSVSGDLDQAKVILNRMKNYNSKGFSLELLYWVKDLEYFYNNLVEASTGKDPSKTYFHINPTSMRPKVGQVAYVNLRRGYPKEVYDGHYCYIFKDFGVKYIVIPTTSVKPNSSAVNPRFEIDIDVKDFINKDITRLQVSDIRSVDIQRIKISKGLYEVTSDHQTIKDQVNTILN